MPRWMRRLWYRLFSEERPGEVIQHEPQEFVVTARWIVQDEKDETSESLDKMDPSHGLKP